MVVSQIETRVSQVTVAVKSLFDLTIPSIDVDIIDSDPETDSSNKELWNGP